MRRFIGVNTKIHLSSRKTAQQSVNLTGGILRHFRALSTPEQNPALGVLSTPAHPQVTPAVGQPRARYERFQELLDIIPLSNFYLQGL